MDKLAVCIICGKEFEKIKHNQKTCSGDCRRKQHKILCDKRYEEQVKRKRERDKEVHHTQNNISTNADRAAVLGISYGQYMSRKDYYDKIIKGM